MDTNLYILKHTVLIYSFVFGLAILLTLFFHRTNWGRNMFVAIVSWLVIFAAFVFTSYISIIVFSCLIFIIAFIALWEYYNLNSIWNLSLIVISALLLLLMLYSILSQQINLYYLTPGISVLIYFSYRLLHSSPKQINKDVGIEVAGLIYWGWIPFHFVLLHRLEHGFGYIVLLCTLIALNDNSAYYVGKLLGKKGKKLAPNISPGKTWIGFIGGSIVTFIVAFAFRYTVPHFSYIDLLILALIVTILIPIGDLIESAIKRDVGVKDSGSLIPGHGGMMDRFDSWIFSVPIVYYYLLYIYN